MASGSRAPALHAGGRGCEVCKRFAALARYAIPSESMSEANGLNGNGLPFPLSPSVQAEVHFCFSFFLPNNTILTLSHVLPINYSNILIEVDSMKPIRIDEDEDWEDEDFDDEGEEEGEEEKES